jgi:allantoinase
MTNEPAAIIAARDGVAAAIGQVPKGWCGQDFNESAETPALLAEAGFHYTTDWANDDRPYVLGNLLTLPPQPEWNDLECMWLRRVSPRTWAANIAEAFEVLHAEGGSTFNLTLHPWIAGQAHRIRYLRDALHHSLGKPHVWRTTTDVLAETARRQLG